MRFCCTFCDSDKRHTAPMMTLSRGCWIRGGNMLSGGGDAVGGGGGVVNGGGSGSRNTSGV